MQCAHNPLSLVSTSVFVGPCFWKVFVYINVKLVSANIDGIYVD